MYFGMLLSLFSLIRIVEDDTSIHLASSSPSFHSPRSSLERLVIAETMMSIDFIKSKKNHKSNVSSQEQEKQPGSIATKRKRQ